MQPTILLDTQVVIWLYKNRTRIGKIAMQLIERQDQPLAVSYFSFLEMAIKNATGKLNYEDKIWDELASVGIQIIMPNRAMLEEYRIFAPGNKDPFDNLLIAAAIEIDCTLMSADRQILATKVRGLKTIDATK